VASPGPVYSSLAFGSYASSASSREETIDLDDLRRVQHVDVSDEPVARAAERPEELRDDARPRATPSLAMLGMQYSFRPWYAVSEFVMAGYPLPYPESLAGTYDKRAMAASPDLAPPATEAVRPSVPLVPYAPGTFGGITFQISPVDAAVFVDGVYAGLVEDFTPVEAPLPLTVGVHRIELRAPGYRVELFDVVVTLGLVTPLSGLLAQAF
jgi:hypothetical protein